MFTDTCTIQSDTEASDNAGGMAVTSASGASSPCLLRPLSGGAEQVVAERLGWSEAYAIDLPVAVAVSTDQRLVIAGRTFEIGSIAHGGAMSLIQTVIAQERG